MMKIYFIRHGLTKGNMEKRYIGSTDELLCEQGIAALKKLSYPECDAVISSSMKRCIQTAGILFPNSVPIICENLTECSFGDFEGKNYIELSGNTSYQKWIDSDGTLPFPNGESPDDFRKRTVMAFDDITQRYACLNSAAFVVHGGTIMAILDKYSYPHKDYFSWHIDNGRCIVCEYDGSHLIVKEQI